MTLHDHVIILCRKKEEYESTEELPIASQAIEIPDLPDERRDERVWPSLPPSQSMIFRHRQKIPVSDERQERRSQIEYLPAEMLLAIEVYLPESSQFAFRTTSPEMRSKLGILKWKNEYMRRTFAQNVRFDDSCKAERTEQSKRWWLMNRKEGSEHGNICLHCKERHDPSLFSTQTTG